MRRAAKRDANEMEIVNALRQVGALVMHLDKFDLLVCYRGRLFMLDAKTRFGRTTMAQERLTEDGWPLMYVRDAYQALDAIGVGR